jgi:hypothetical protein
MTIKSAHSPRKVKKNITEIIPEVKLQETQQKRYYNRNGGSLWFWTIIRIIITVGMIIWAFILGIRIGFGDFDAALWIAEKKNPIDPMISSCQLIPDMAGCEKYTTWTSHNHMINPMDMSMKDMWKMLEWKTWSGLDKAFLEAMIPHHEWAVIMAGYLSWAEHIELKKMWETIINAQNKEIEQMKKWQIEWGYKTPPTPTEKIAL